MVWVHGIVFIYSSGSSPYTYTPVWSSVGHEHDGDVIDIFVHSLNLCFTEWGTLGTLRLLYGSIPINTLQFEPILSASLFLPRNWLCLF